MGKLGILRTIGLFVALALIAWGVAGLAQVLSGPNQRDLGPGIVVNQSFVPSEVDPSATPTAEETGQTAEATESSSPSQETSTPTPKPTKTTSPDPAPTVAPKPTRTQGPVKPLPPKTPKVYVDDDDDDDDWDDDDDDWDDDDDDDDDD